MAFMETAPDTPVFRQPTAMERAFNRCFGFLVGLGLGMKHNYLLQVRGRKSGKLYSTPIDLLERDGKRFLVAPRGRTQWVRNAEAAGEITLKRGGFRQTYRLRAIPDAEKQALLKAYLDRFETMAQRYFPVQAGSDAQAFSNIAKNYPVFALTIADSSSAEGKAT
jgi:deazaflavin-dependent oxidoreductase (nitroreductase family)